jgi:uncharacterized protein YbjT (DUF2867 family)
VIVGCGCRGQSLARELRAQGHAVRGTTRDPARAAAIEAAGAESHIGDPDRIGTLTAALDGATILCWLLGSAAGPGEAVAPLHGTRLGMLLERAIDTTVRGVLYEAAGSLDPELLSAGSRIVAEACGRSQIPYRVLAVDPADHAAWLADARAGVDELLR